jgi:hypothetical protein
VHLLEKVDRLISFCNLEDFDYKALNLNHDDAINFLIQTQGLGLGSQRIILLQKFLLKKLKAELDLDLVKLLKSHDKTLDRIQEQYN